MPSEDRYVSHLEKTRDQAFLKLERTVRELSQVTLSLPRETMVESEQVRHVLMNIIREINKGGN